MASPAELQQRGIEAHRAGRFSEAEACYRSLLATHPHPAILCNLGLALVAQGRHAEAVPLFERALAARPGDANGRVALANALIFSDRPAEALAHCDAVLAGDAQSLDARHNRAVALRALNRHREAIDELRGLLARDPADADAEFNLALSLLAMGDYGAGWRHYEARWRGRAPHRALAHEHIPAWKPGTAIGAQRILVQAEQGFGDTLQFVRWLRPGMSLQAPAPLASLLRRNLAGIAVIEDGAEPPAGFGLRLPLMSLPLALGLDEAGLFRFCPYLRADGARVREWAARLEPAARRWAFAWRGRPTHRFDRQRSLPLERLAPFLDAAARTGLRLVAVQKDLTEAERALLSRRGIEAPDAALADFDDTAAVLAACERLVSVDTSVAHLAGAMGMPGTVLLPFSPDFRWGLAGGASRFYPSLRLARAAAPGDWSAALAALVSEIR